MGGTVAAGSITSTQTADRLTLTQSGNRAILDWQSFNIGSGRTVEFVQPGASATVLNRVSASAGLSEVHGSLVANGMVLLVNPNGVLFGQGAQVNVAALIATTGTVQTDRFMDAGPDGGIVISGAAGSVHNRGQITAAGAGLVALVAPSVVNEGRITATGGRIALAGSDRATVSLSGGLYEFTMPAGASGSAVSNAVGARLEGARLLLSTGDAATVLTGVINLEGVAQASNLLVVDGGTVQLRAALEAPQLSGQSRRIEVSPGVRIADAVGIARTGSAGDGATVALLAGDHAQQAVLDKANLTLSGEPGARLVVPDLAEVNGISIRANHVTVQGVEIAGPVNQPYYDYYATPRGNVSRGIAVADGISGFTVRNNRLYDLRTGVLIHGRNSTGTVTGNEIENTKSAISVQYTDATGLAIAGNAEGAVGNEWGLNLHLNGHLDGSGNIRSNSTPIAASPTEAWQRALLDFSSANNGWSVQDQAYTSSNRTRVQVAPSGAAGSQGSRLTPINSLQAGVAAVVAGGTVAVSAGSYTQNSTLTVNKPLTLAGAGESLTTIDARGIASGYGLSVSADNVTLKDFTLYGPSAYYPSAYGIKVSPAGAPGARLRNFTITNVTSRGAGKAELDLNGVDGALVDQVTLDGAPAGYDAGTTQGAGLQITDSANVTVRHSATLNNGWGGVALYQANRSYDQRVQNIRIEGSNRLQESNPLYLQDESALHDFGALEIAGFAYGVRNTGSAASVQYTWLQPTLQRAYDHAVNLPGDAASVIQRWDGAALTQDFEVGVGQLAGGGTRAMSLASAINQSASGAAIRVAAGSYDETLSLGGPRQLLFDNVTLQGLQLGSGAAGSGIGGGITALGSAGILVQAPVRLLADTRLATSGASIHVGGHVSNGGATPYSLTLWAGSGASRGDVSMVSGGSEAAPLNALDVRANRYVLSETLWVRRYAIDALGLVALSNQTLRATDAAANNTLTTVGGVSGSTIALGSVTVSSGGDVNASVTAAGAASVTGNNIAGSVQGSSVAVAAQGRASVDVVATQTATVTADSVSGSVSAPVAAVDAVGAVQLVLDVQTATVHSDGQVQLTGAAERLQLDAPGGSVSGAMGEVSNSGSGVLMVNGRPALNPTLAQSTDTNRVLPAEPSLADSGPQTPTGYSVPAAALPLVLASGVQVLRSQPAGAAGALDRGQSVELDLSPDTRRRPVR